MLQEHGGEAQDRQEPPKVTHTVKHEDGFVKHEDGVRWRLGGEHWPRSVKHPSSLLSLV